MGCCVQLVMGPAGSGKSTYCQVMQEHCASLGKLRGRSVHVANLDPAAETFKYDVAFDVRDLITVEDVMEELGLGPNGALVYSMEYLLENSDWLKDEMDQYDDDEYLILDCPGQLELYTHVPVMKQVIDLMKRWGYESHMVSVFVVDATFVCDAPKFISGALLSLSAMVALELPHVNVLSKCDLVDMEVVSKVLDTESATQLWQIEEESVMRDSGYGYTSSSFDKNLTLEERQALERRRKRHKLTESICTLLDDYSMVSYLPLDTRDEDSIDVVLAHIDHSVQYGENAEVRGADFDDFQNDEE